MEKTKVRKFRLFWAWQDEAEENWLEKMSQKGYHFSSVSPPGFYTFSAAEPKNYIYRLDYQTFHKKDKREYSYFMTRVGSILAIFLPGYTSVRKLSKVRQPRFSLTLSLKSLNIKEY